MSEVTARLNDETGLGIIEREGYEPALMGRVYWENRSYLVPQDFLESRSNGNSPETSVYQIRGFSTKSDSVTVVPITREKILDKIAEVVGSL